MLMNQHCCDISIPENQLQNKAIHHTSLLRPPTGDRQVTKEQHGKYWER